MLSTVLIEQFIIMSSQDQTQTTASTNSKNDTPVSSSLLHSEKSFMSSSASSSVKSSRQNKPSSLQKISHSSKGPTEKDVDVTESDTDNTSTASNASDTIRVEDLEIIKTIGTGTFARVCLCRLRNPSGGSNNNNNNNGKAIGEAGNAQQQPTPRTSKYFALKILTMHDVIRLKQVEHVKNEKNILMDIKHPFIIDLVWHAKDNKTFLYMIFPYICGGELFSYLRSAGRFNAPTSLFYTCEIVSALEYLHSLSIVYR